MHQEREGEGPEDMKAQDSKLNPMQAEQQHPQKCPRCESLYTKFCYYNNYSLSQPRYYCKACKRYWTQGGSLRNVPIGGASRKGKRAKASSPASESSRSQLQPSQPQQLQQNLANPPAIIPCDPFFTPSPALMPPESGNLASYSGPPIQSIAPYYAGGGGYLSSLATIQSLNQTHSFSQPLTYARGRDLMGSSNLDLLQGFTVPSFVSQQQQRQVQQRPFYSLGNVDRSMEPVYFTGETWRQSSRQTSSSPHDWHQNFLNNINPTASDTILWSLNSAATGNANGNKNAASTSNPSQWPDLPGFRPPP